MLDFSYIFQEAPIGICISIDNIISACNVEACRIFGYSAGELIGKDIYIICGNFDIKTSTTHCNTFPESSNLLVPPQRIMTRKGGQAFWCQVTNSALSTTGLFGQIWTFMEVLPVGRINNELSYREKQLAASILSGKTCKNIALDVGLSVRTVEFYRQRLMKKLNVTNHAGLILRLASFVRA